MKEFKFREYTQLPILTSPLIAGEIPLKENLSPGKIHIIAYGKINDDGKHIVSLYNEETDTHYQERMTFDEINEISKKDGVELILVPDDFKFGEYL